MKAYIAFFVSIVSLSLRASDQVKQTHFSKKQANIPSFLLTKHVPEAGFKEKKGDGKNESKKNLLGRRKSCCGEEFKKKMQAERRKSSGTLVDSNGLVQKDSPRFPSQSIDRSPGSNSQSRTWDDSVLEDQKRIENKTGKKGIFDIDPDPSK